MRLAALREDLERDEPGGARRALDLPHISDRSRPYLADTSPTSPRHAGARRGAAARRGAERWAAELSVLSEALTGEI